MTSRTLPGQSLLRACTAILLCAIGGWGAAQTFAAPNASAPAALNAAAPAAPASAPLASPAPDVPRRTEAELIQATVDTERSSGRLSNELDKALQELSDFYYFVQRPADWIRTQQRILSLRTEAHGPDSLLTARAWLNLGAGHAVNRDPQNAETAYLRALTIRERQLGPDHVDVAFALTNLGANYRELARYGEARKALDRALDIRLRVLGSEHINVSFSLTFIGDVYMDVGDPASALLRYRQALFIREHQPQASGHGSRDRLVAESLGHIAEAEGELGDVDAARRSQQRVLELATRNDGDSGPTLQRALRDTGSMLMGMAEYAGALQLLQRSRAMASQVHGTDHPNYANVTSVLGVLQHRAGNPALAAELQREALAIDQTRLGPEHPVIALRRRRLASALAGLGERETAMRELTAARAISVAARGPMHSDHLAYDLELAAVARLEGDMPAARAALVSALAIARHNQGEVSGAMAGVVLEQAELALASGQETEAHRLAAEGVPLAVLGRAGDRHARLLEILGAANEALGQAGAGLFWRKQAVNRIQSFRPGSSRAPADFQRSFLASRRSSFIQLADRLIRAGKLSEARKVVAMLKEGELRNAAPGDSGVDPLETRAPFAGAAESRADDRYRAVLEALALTGAARRTAEVSIRLGEISADGESATTAQGRWTEAVAEWRHLVEQVTVDMLGEAAPAADGRPDPEIRTLLHKIGNGAALLHYVVTEQGLVIMLNTASRQLARTVPIDPARLNQHVAELRRALQQKQSFRSASRALYDLLIAPMRRDLERAGVRSLMLSLDGSLRYLPFAALHDGERFLVERYALSLFNPAAPANVSDVPKPRWSLTGLGATRGNEELAPLPGVRDELQRIGAGPLPASIYLDDAFTPQRLATALQGPDPLLHLATHFTFRPGALDSSYLLLGDNSRLSLQDIRRRRLSFAGVELLTLSACDTAFGGGLDETGAEIESFAALAQLQGAKAVLATLWPVADSSTADFMVAFYNRRSQGRGMAKAEALRRTQMAFIRSQAHPYVWAAWLLMGNPR